RRCRRGAGLHQMGDEVLDMPAANIADILDTGTLEPRGELFDRLPVRGLRLRGQVASPQGSQPRAQQVVDRGAHGPYVIRCRNGVLARVRAFALVAPPVGLEPTTRCLEVMAERAAYSYRDRPGQPPSPVERRAEVIH